MDKNTKQKQKMIKEMAGRDELNFLEALLILIGTIALFIFVQTMLEIRQDSRLVTCELRGDCSEVIKHIND